MNRLNADNSFIQEKQSINTLGDVEFTELGSTSIRTARYFDAIGRLVKETDPDGVATLYAYDANGRQSITAVDMNRNGVIDYTGGDRITRNLSEVGVRDGFTVQRTTTQVWETDNQDSPNSISVSESSVDGLRTWQTVRGQTSSSVIAYDGQGGRTITSIGLGNLKMVQSYLGNRLLSTVTMTADNTQITATTNAYDSSGKLATTTDARNGATSFNYDAQDRLLSVVTPDPDPARSGPGYDPQAISYTYDAMGRMTAVTQPDGGVVNSTYYPTGAAKRTWGTRTYPVEYTYDVQGQLKTLTTWQNFAGDAGKAVTIWNYDSPLGRLVNKRYPDNTGPSYTYTAAGRMSTRSWARTPAVSVSYTFNNAGEVSLVNYSDATPDVTTAYDRLGRVSSVADGAGTRTFAYHASGQLQNENYTAGLLNGTGVTRTFDTLDRLASVSANAATTLVSTAYGYDPASRLKTVTTGADTATYAYAANSNLVATLTLARSGSTRVVTARTYDALNRLASIVNDLNAASANLRHGYTYNAANQRTRATREDNSYWSFAYDNLGQVVTGSKYRADDVATPGHAFNWTYDDIGNRKTAVQNGQTTNYTSSLLNNYVQATVPAVADVIGAAATDATVTVSADGGIPQPTARQSETFYKQLAVDNTAAAKLATLKITGVKNLVGPAGEDAVTEITKTAFLARTPETFTHDTDGNLTADGRWLYSWDAENRLIALETLPAAAVAGLPRQKLEFVHDGQGRRVAKKVSNWSGTAYTVAIETRFIYDGWNLLAEVNALAANAPIRTYVWGLDLSGSTQGAGGVGGLLAVNSGTSTYAAAYDGNGNVSALVNAADGTLAARYDYNAFGERVLTDGPAALLNPFRFSTKYEDPETGLLYYGFRYYNPSTGRWLGRDPIGEAGGLNLYVMVGNNAIDFIDVLGERMLAPRMLPRVVPRGGPRPWPNNPNPQPKPTPNQTPNPGRNPSNHPIPPIPNGPESNQQDNSSNHFGKFDANWCNIEKTVTWAQPTPLTKTQALALLDRLESQLAKSILRDLRPSFEKARSFIRKRGPEGITAPPPYIRSWDVQGTKSDRVDVEVHGGRAFSNDDFKAPQPREPQWGDNPWEA